MIAANSASSSSYEVRIRPLMVESIARTSRHTSMPLPSGRRASSTATSGRIAGMRRVASCAEPDSPTTSMSPAACSRSARPRRTTSWSSSRKTRIMVPSYLSPSRSPRDQSPSAPGRWSGHPDRGADVGADGQPVVDLVLQIVHHVHHARHLTGQAYHRVGGGAEVQPAGEGHDPFGDLDLDGAPFDRQYPAQDLLADVVTEIRVRTQVDLEEVATGDD